MFHILTSTIDGFKMGMASVTQLQWSGRFESYQTYLGEMACSGFPLTMTPTALHRQSSTHSIQVDGVEMIFIHYKRGLERASKQ